MTAAPAVACRELRIRQFRVFAELELAIPTGGAAVVGDNGSGKTSLLEALYYLEIFRSFRAAPDEQLVRIGAEAFHLRGRFEELGTGAEFEIEAGFELRGRRKRVTVNGAEPARLGDALGRIGAVVFAPTDVAIAAGPPAERRRFLDIVLSLNRPGYLAALQRYRQILRQRNALLRRGAPPDLLRPWDDALVEWGARVMAARAAWVERHAPAFARRFAAVSGGPTACLRYRPAADAPDDGGALTEEAAAAALRAALDRLARLERERGTTLAGPHRDDLPIALAAGGPALDLRDYGSAGEQRTAAIALRMVEADTIREARGREPLVLLDDVFAELDPDRARRVLALLEAEGRGQVLLTAPKASDLEPRRTGLPHWRLADGRILP